MTFYNAEVSTQDGQPVALYLIEWDQTRWAYTSADREIESGGITYMPIAISDGGMVQGGSSQNDFSVTLPADVPIVEVFRGTPPSAEIWLTVRRIHFGEEGAPIYWTGTVTNVKRKGAFEAEIIAQPITASFRRTGARLAWTRECPHFLYDSECKVNPEDYRQEGTITGKTGTTLTIAGLPAYEPNYYRGGMAIFAINDDGTLEHRMIENAIGPVFTMLGLTDGFEVGMTIAVYPGCDRTPATCRARFDNIPNYGGHHYMPGKTPFGTMVF